VKATRAFARRGFAAHDLPGRLADLGAIVPRWGFHANQNGKGENRRASPALGILCQNAKINVRLRNATRQQLVNDVLWRASFAVHLGKHHRSSSRSEGRSQAKLERGARRAVY